VNAGIKPFRQNFAEGPNVLRDLIASAVKTQADAKAQEIEVAAQAAVAKAKTDLQKKQAETVTRCRKTVEEPAGLLEAIKTRWLPKKVLARWPVRTVKVDHWIQPET
jgi:hypothetical protein